MKSSRKVQKNGSLILTHTASALAQTQVPCVSFQLLFFGSNSQLKSPKKGSLILINTTSFWPKTISFQLRFFGRKIPDLPMLHCQTLKQLFNLLKIRSLIFTACTLVPGHFMDKLLEFSSIFMKFARRVMSRLKPEVTTPR